MYIALPAEEKIRLEARDISEFGFGLAEFFEGIWREIVPEFDINPTFQVVGTEDEIEYGDALSFSSGEEIRQIAREIIEKGKLS